MHFDDGCIPLEYRRFIRGKLLFLTLLGGLLLTALVAGVSLGSVNLPLGDVLRGLCAPGDGGRVGAILWNIRLPQVLTAIVAGGGLALSGAAMQSILRNPLGSPFTLGISHAAAFGAALAVMLQGSRLIPAALAGPLSGSLIVTLSAFLFSLISAFVIISVSRLRGTSSEIMILAGVALGALFTAATMLLQFFADDVQLAAMVFWTFGDTTRASWNELGFLTLVTLVSSFYFVANSWNYNAIDAGDETARGLGIRIERVRICTMLVASLLTAVVISLLGIIGFVGLIVPHMVRRVIGSDHRFLLPATLLSGGVLLALADTAAKLILHPQVLPVSVLTAFLGAPAFFYLVIRRKG
jgi:iron complex transport system permease protein